MHNRFSNNICRLISVLFIIINKFAGFVQSLQTNSSITHGCTFGENHKDACPLSYEISIQSQTKLRFLFFRHSHSH